MRRSNCSWEEAVEKAIFICGIRHLENNVDCFRKVSGHSKCKGCPKYNPRGAKLAPFFFSSK